MQRSSHYYRRSSNHGSSSAFSPNANPNEDWTKISDLAERRRIQNRIAQRNYRKKLKRRLEDLEKRAASGSMSPDEAIEPRTRGKPAATAAGRKTTRASRSNITSSTTSSSNSLASSTMTAATPIKTEPTDPYSYYQSPSTTPAERPLPFEPSLAEDGGGIMFDSHCTRQLSASPPPVLSFTNYPSLSAYGQPIYGPSSSSSSSLYPPPSSSFSATVTTPSSFSDAHPFSTAADYATGTPVKRYSGDEGILSPFNMSYASMDGIGLEPDYHHAHAHQHQNHHHHHHHHQPHHNPHAHAHHAAHHAAAHHPHHHAHSHQPQLLSHLSVLPALGQGHGDDRSMSTPSTPADIPLVHPLTPESDPCSPRSFSLF